MTDERILRIDCEPLAVASTDYLRELATANRDIQFYTPETGIGLYHPRLSQKFYPDDEPHRIKSFGAEVESRPIQFLSGCGVLKNIWKSDYPGDDGGLAYLEFDTSSGTTDKPLLVAISLKPRFIPNEQIDFGWQIEENGQEHWEYKPKDTWLAESVSYDKTKMARPGKTFGHSYMEFGATVGKQMTKTSTELISRLQKMIGVNIGFSYNPERDHHFCDWDPTDFGPKFYSTGVMVHGINYAEALWL